MTNCRHLIARSLATIVVFLSLSHYAISQSSGDRSVIDAHNLDKLQIFYSLDISDVFDTEFWTVPVALVVSPDDRWIGVVAGQGTCIVDVNSEFQIYAIPFTSNENVEFLSQDRIVSMSSDGILEIWDINTSEMQVIELTNIDEAILDIDVNVFLNLLVAVTSSQVYIWDTNEFVLQQEIVIPPISSSDLSTFVYISPSGEFIVVDPPTPQFFILDRENEEVIEEIEQVGWARIDLYDSNILIYTNTSPDSLLRFNFETPTRDGYMLLTEAISQEEMLWIPDVSPVSGIMIFTDYLGNINIADHDGSVLRTLSAHNGPVFQYRFSSLGRYIVSADNSLNNKMIIWNVDG